MGKIRREVTIEMKWCLLTPSRLEVPVTVTISHIPGRRAGTALQILRFGFKDAF
jgi:hypothetical protein